MAHIYTHGTGVELDPYQIWTWEDFVGMGDYTGVFYKLMQNLNAQNIDHYADPDNYTAWTADDGFPLIAEFVDNVLDGNSKTISDFSLNRPDEDLVAPIQYMYKASADTKIHDLTISGAFVSTYGYCSPLVAFAYQPCVLENITITGCTVEGGNRMAGLIGQTEWYLGDPAGFIDITNCHVVNMNVEGAGFGGLVYLGETCRIYQCSVEADIVLVEPTIGTVGYVGGMIAECFDSNSAEQCFVDMSVTDAALEAGAVCIGGIYGYAGVPLSADVASTILDCYVFAQLANAPLGGGLIGQGLSAGQTEPSSVATSSYSANTVTAQTDYNGAVGTPFEAGQAVKCYYNSDLVTPTADDGSLPLTSAEMQVQANFTDWDFDTVWGIDPLYHNGWPHFKWQHTPVVITDPVDPKLLIRYRNDGKPNWSNYREVSLGKLGDTEIFKRIPGLGCYRNRQYEIVCTAGVPLTITGLEENVNLGGTRGE